MTGFADALRRHPLAWFLAIAVGIEVLLVPLFLLGGGEALAAAFEETDIEPGTDYLTALRVALAAPEAIPDLILVCLQPLTPTIAAFAVAALAFGRSGLRNLVGRFRFWHASVGSRRGLATWGLMVAVFVGMSLATAALDALFMPEGTWGWDWAALSSGLLPALIVAMFLDIGGLGEETGWRGLALPILQDRMAPLAASVALGVMWWLWHFPARLELLTLSYGLVGSVALLAILGVRFVFLAVVMTYFHNRVGGSILIAVAMHGLHNDSAGLMGRITGEGLAPYVISELALLAPIAAVACAVLFFSGPSLALTKPARWGS
jgi:membrane protease YdiL (CAAX protease family)